MTADTEVLGREETEGLVNGLISVLEDAHGVSVTEWTPEVKGAYDRLLRHDAALRAHIEELEDALAFIECNDCDAGGVADHDDPAYDVECAGDRNIRIARRALEGTDE